MVVLSPIHEQLGMDNGIKLIEFGLKYLYNKQLYVKLLEAFNLSLWFEILIVISNISIFHVIHLLRDNLTI